MFVCLYGGNQVDFMFIYIQEKKTHFNRYPNNDHVYSGTWFAINELNIESSQCSKICMKHVLMQLFFFPFLQQRFLYLAASG